MIYLDNSATTKPCQEAVEAVTKALTEGWANPSALYEFGIDAARSMRDARTAVAKAMGAEGYKAETPEEFAAALDKAYEAEGPAVIECIVDKTDMVYPMVPSNKSIDEIIIQGGK